MGSADITAASTNSVAGELSAMYAVTHRSQAAHESVGVFEELLGLDAASEVKEDKQGKPLNAPGTPDPDTNWPSDRSTVAAAAQHAADLVFGRYRYTLRVIDLFACLLATGLGFFLRFGSSTAEPNALPYPTIVLLMPLASVIALSMAHAYAPRIVGAGSEEFRRVFRAFFGFAAAVAITAYSLHADLARGFVLAALPSALIFVLIGRYLARLWLHQQRSRGMARVSTLAIGNAKTILDFKEILDRDAAAPLEIIGATLLHPHEATDQDLQALAQAGIPVVGDVDGILETVTRARASTVAVLSSAEVGPQRLRWISWQLEQTDAELVVSPGLTEVAGNRLHIQPVAGLPLVYVGMPEFTGLRRVGKAAFDRTIAALALVALSPLLLTLAVLVRLDSSGPAFFRQTRVGLGGRHFRILKLRSMVNDAEQRKAELKHLNENDGPTFKMVNDPRITKIGRFIRATSLDELPQLINVLKGEMSLVGPRPPLPSEVEEYGSDVHRRLLVKPGLTGLHQVNGRSDLGWDDAVRYDLRYVENWSFTMDLMILWKTLSTVLRRDGAY